MTTKATISRALIIEMQLNSYNYYRNLGLTHENCLRLVKAVGDSDLPVPLTLEERIEHMDIVFGKTTTTKQV